MHSLKNKLIFGARAVWHSPYLWARLKESAGRAVKLYIAYLHVTDDHKKIMRGMESYAGEEELAEKAGKGLYQKGRLWPKHKTYL